METLTELIHNMFNSTLRGYIGVTFIFAYMAWLVGMALYRVKKGDHLGHH